MLGLSATSSETLSPTGCTKQLISVARMSVPPAELMRPAGMKPRASAARNRACQRARSAGVSTAAIAVLTRWWMSSAEDSVPLAYFSSSTSVEMACGASAASILGRSLSFMTNS